VFLKELTVTNIRSIAELSLQFDGSADDNDNRKWTFLIGENGMGKSTILRSVALLLSGSEALPELLVRPRDWVRNGATEGRIKAVLETQEGKSRTIELTLRRDANVTEAVVENQKALFELDAALKHTPRNYMTIGYGASRRLSPTSSSTASRQDTFRQPRAGNVATLFSSDAQLNPLDTWAMDLDYRHEKGRDIVGRALEHLLPGVEFSHIDKSARTLLFNTADGLVPLAMLSDGYQNMAAWCGDLLYRVTETFRDYENPFAARGLLLIDEIDLHLHPTWQRQLRAFLDEKFPKMQIVATTHSPLTVQQADEGEVFVLAREGTSPPRLQAFAGTPRDMLVHQLVLSPMFGIGSMESLQVEKEKDEYRELSKPGPTDAPSQRRRDELRERLTNLPEFSLESPYEQKRVEVLEQISKLVKATSAKPKAKAKAAPKVKVKAKAKAKAKGRRRRR
jgi:predicted ATPase